MKKVISKQTFVHRLLCVFILSHGCIAASYAVGNVNSLEKDLASTTLNEILPDTIYLETEQFTRDTIIQATSTVFISGELSTSEDSIVIIAGSMIDIGAGAIFESEIYFHIDTSFHDGQITSVDDSKNLGSFQISPNPAIDFINIHKKTNERAVIVISDANGIQKINTNMEGVNERLDVGNLVPGMYLMEIKENGVPLKKEKLFIVK